MVEILNEPVVWLIILMIALAVAVARYWNTPITSSVFHKLKQSEELVTKLQKVAEKLTQNVRDLESKLQKQLDAVESKVTNLSGDVGNVKRETFEIDKHVGTLEIKTETAASKVDAIMHQVDIEVSELKRIEDQIKDSAGKVKTNAVHIQYLEDEVRGLVRELSGTPVRVRRHPYMPLE